MEIFEKGNHIVFGGDAIDILRSRIENASIDLIFAKSFNRKLIEIRYEHFIIELRRLGKYN